MNIVYSATTDGLGGHVRLQLSRVEGELLSVRSSRGEDAAVLRGAFSDGRDQLHVLPHAEREAGLGLGGADAVAVQADAQGVATDHARQPAEEHRIARGRVLSGG